MSWLEIDWKRERPASAALTAVAEHLEAIPDAVQELLDEMRRIFSNGGVVFSRFLVRGDADFDWFATRNRWLEIDFCQGLLQDPIVAAALGEAAARADFASIKFEWSSSLTLDGDLAKTLVFGGAHDAFAGSAREAKDLGARVAAAMFDDRYAEVEVFRTWQPWSPWFHDIAWDGTYIVIDRRTQVVSVLAWTDLD